jgi:hypothetical protein
MALRREEERVAKELGEARRQERLASTVGAILSSESPADAALRRTDAVFNQVPNPNPKPKPTPIPIPIPFLFLPLVKNKCNLCHTTRALAIHLTNFTILLTETSNLI